MLCLWLKKSHYSVCSQKTAVKFVLIKKNKKNLMYQSTKVLHKCFNNFTFKAFAQVFPNMIKLTQKVRNIRFENSNNFTLKSIDTLRFSVSEVE